ncbi:MAG: nitrophenyl compound nitroreductase subunit ArsF family protein [Marinifilaceae bacterium]
MKKLVLFGIIVLFAVACREGAKQSAQSSTVTISDDVTEVYYFHSKQRCLTCNAIEKLTKEVVDSLGNAKIVMRTVDISNKDNKALMDKYEVNWSSLFVVKQDKSENLTIMAFAHAVGSPQTFKRKLVEEIEKMRSNGVD